MATLTYLYEPLTTVYHVSEDHGIREAVVQYVDIKLDGHTTTLKYTIQLTKMPGAKQTVDEVELYTDIPSAQAAYEPLISA
jgi:hypothetical protein